MQSSTTEDYLKAIFKLSSPLKKGVSTNSIAEELSTKASSVSDMLKKLSDRNLVHYVKYQGSNLTKQGEKIALRVIRKHRLWEVFLVEKLKFGWDEIHEIAEQLEHIKSSKLIDKLDAYLNFPKNDPHGDPIPDKNGLFPTLKKLNLNELKIGEKAIIIGVSEDSKDFLSYLDKVGLKLGSTIEVLDYFSFDKSLKVKVNNDSNLTLSQLVTKNLNISKEK
jgi:DtxR family Mn-dependent transcriptional regulator